MFSGKPSDDSNPFAFAAQPARSGRRQSLLSALKFLALAAIALTVMLLVSTQSQLWLVQRLTHDFESLPTTEKQHRLTQLHAIGMPAIESIVSSLCDDDDGVARTAYELLRAKQDDWAVLDRKETITRHAVMVRSMNPIVDLIPDDRTVWTTGLLQNSITVSVNRTDEASKRLYAAATKMLDRMSLSQRSGPSVLVGDPQEFDQPRQLTLRQEPLPVAPSESIDQWTDWPPPKDQQPAIYRSSASKLQPIAANEKVVLSDVHQHRAASSSPDVADRTDDELVARPPAPVHRQPESAVTSDIRPVGLLVESPLETYDIKSVVYWLGNSHEPLRVAAKAELARRGLSENEIAIATRIAAGDLQTKLALVDHIARNSSIDPRPWLLLLLADPSRDVKLKTVSVLATIKDPAVERHLRNHILDEPDPTVAFRIRRLLDLR